MYAAGKIPGGFIKREGRPTENAILTARLTDRPLRPLFPKDYRNDVQVVITVLSADQVNDPAICSIIGASAALTISDIPFYGPVGAVQGRADRRRVRRQPDHARDGVLGSRPDGGRHRRRDPDGRGRREGSCPRRRSSRRSKPAHEEIQPHLRSQIELQQAAGKPKREFAAPEVRRGSSRRSPRRVGNRLEETIYDPDKATREDSTQELRKRGRQALRRARYDPKAVAKVFGALEKEIVRTQHPGARAGGRTAAR